VLQSVQPEERMRAVVHDRYGPPEVMRLEDVERPVPKDDEVLVRVCASTVTRSDTALRSAEYGFTRAFTGLRGPKQRIAGMELAGFIEVAGTAVSRFRVGDAVFGIRSGANAEYVCVRERGVLAHKPANITFEQAAAVPDGACTALAFVEAEQDQDDDRGDRSDIGHEGEGRRGSRDTERHAHPAIALSEGRGPEHRHAQREESDRQEQ
jgi:NADPH:quinone reductase-like Zn-dependent oxidoreductase